MKWGYIILLTVGLIAQMTFVVLYAAKSREWRRSDLGRNLMAKSVIIGGLLALSLIGLLTVVPTWVWYGGMISLDAVMWWRVAILWRIQHEPDPPTGRPT